MRALIKVLVAALAPLAAPFAVAQTCPVPPVTVQLTDVKTQTAISGGIAAGRSYTVNLGQPAANRSIIIVDGFRDTGTCPLASLTIDGVPLVRAAQQIDAQNFTSIMSIWIVPWPNNASATIASTYCANVDSAEGIAVYAAYGLNSTVPIDKGGSNSTTNPVINLESQTGAIGIAGAWALNQASGFSKFQWFGPVNLDYAVATDPTGNGQYQFGGSIENLGSSFVFSGVYGATSSYEPAAVAATFR